MRWTFGPAAALLAVLWGGAGCEVSGAGDGSDAGAPTGGTGGAPSPGGSADAATGGEADAHSIACGNPLSGTVEPAAETRAGLGVTSLAWRFDRDVGTVTADAQGEAGALGTFTLAAVAADGVLHDRELDVTFATPEGGVARIELRGVIDAPGQAPVRQYLGFTVDGRLLSAETRPGVPTRWWVDAPVDAPRPTQGGVVAEGIGVRFFLQTDDDAELDAWLTELGWEGFASTFALQAALQLFADGNLFRAYADAVSACATAEGMRMQIVDDAYSPLAHCSRLDMCGLAAETAPLALQLGAFGGGPVGVAAAATVLVGVYGLTGVLTACVNDVVKCSCASWNTTATVFCDPCVTENPCRGSCPGEGLGECRTRDENLTDTAGDYSHVVECVCRDPGWCTRHHCNCFLGCLFGDPHVRSLDGLSYDMQGAGEYVLVRSDDGALEIQARLAPGGEGTGFSLTKVVAARLGDAVLTVSAAQGSLPEMDGVALAEGVHAFEGGRVFVEPGLVVLEWDTGDALILGRQPKQLDVEVRPNETRRGRLTGLLGNWNGDPGDDLAPADGSGPLPVASSWDAIRVRFAASWRVTDDTSLLPYGAGETTATYTDEAFPPVATTVDTLDPAARMEAEAVCAAAGAAESAHFRACVVDVASLGADAATWYTGAREPVAVAGEPPPEAPEACFRSGDALAVADGVPTQVDCPRCGGDVPYGAVYGTDVYTSDSAVCPAAIHAGAIPPGGGSARVVFGPGVDAYEGSSRNGIDTAAWGFWGRSFHFVAE